MDFLQQTWLAIPNWKWIFLICAFFIGHLLRPLLQKFLVRLKKLKQTSLIYFQNIQIENPISGIAICIFWLVCLDALSLPVGMDRYMSLLVKVFMAIHIINLLFLSIDSLSSFIVDRTRNQPSALDNQLVPFASRSLKLLVIILGFLMILQNFGVNVVSLLAGLGIGGLALALAAQDTVANLFGSITILMDKPFKIGDLVRITDTEGTVEEIGFRSTRIRTLYNSLITIPNSIVAKEKIDNMGARPYRRIRQVLGIHYDTNPEKIDEFCNRIAQIIQQQPKANQDSINVNFIGFGASALDILVVFHIFVADWTEEQKIQQHVFNDILRLAKSMNIEFAYPTQTVYYHHSQQ